MFNLNPFSSKKTETTQSANETHSNIHESSEGLSNNGISNEALSKEIAKEKEVSFDNSISALRETINIQKNLGLEVSPETVFEMTGMQPEELLAYLEGREVDAHIDNFAEIMKPIEEAMNNLDEKYKDPSKLRNFANNKFTKVAFVAAMLFLKFAPQAKAANTEDTIKDKEVIKNEISVSNHIEPDLDHTYDATFDNFEATSDDHVYNSENPKADFEQIRDMSKINLENYFITDSDQIGESSQKIITDKFKTFLDKITPENIDDILKTNFTIYGSSDERPTSNWGGSNENLTSARLQSIDNLLSHALSEFHSDILSDDEIKQIKAKTFTHSYPIHNDGGENGVTYITDLINEDTGNNYTAGEVKDIKAGDIQKYNNLLEKCRNINFSATMDGAEKLNEIKSITPSLENNPIGEPVLERLAEYKNIVLLFDNSPSMGDSYKYIADAISDQIKDNNHNITFGEFSDKLTGLDNLDNPNEVYGRLNDMTHDGSCTENSFKSTLKALNKINVTNPGEKSVMLVMTDEKFQDVSLDNLDELQKTAKEKGFELKFMYGSDSKKQVREIKIEDVKASYENTIKKILKPTFDQKSKVLDARIQHLDKVLPFLEAKIQKTPTPDNIKALENAKNEINEKTIIYENMKDAWNSGDVSKIFQNESLNKFLIRDNTLDEDFKISIVAEDLGNEIEKI